MTAAELRATGLSLLGTAYTSRAFARLLNVDDRALRRWLAGTRPVPEWVADRLWMMERQRTVRRTDGR